MRPIEGGHQVYSLATDEVTRCTKVTPLPVPPSVIDAVNNIAAQQKQKGLRITARNGAVLYDSSWTAGVDYTSDDEDYDSEDEDLTLTKKILS